MKDDKRYPRFDANGEKLPCRLEGCKNRTQLRGLCMRHYKEYMKGDAFSEPGTGAEGWFDELGNRLICKEEACDQGAEIQGMCLRHYQHWYYEKTRGKSKAKKRGPYFQGPRQCSFETCIKDARGGSLCPGHYEQKRKGQELRPLRHKLPCPVGWCANDMNWNAEMCYKHRALATRYGLDSKAVIALFADGKCGNKHCTETENLHVDHDHSCCPGEKSCGKCVRGLLCASCNIGLGRMQDSPRKLQGLISYLEKFSS